MPPWPPAAGTASTSHPGRRPSRNAWGRRGPKKAAHRGMPRWRRPSAESDRKQYFRNSIPFRAGQLLPTFHPHYLSVYASTRIRSGFRLPGALKVTVRVFAAELSAATNRYVHQSHSTIAAAERKHTGRPPAVHDGYSPSQFRRFPGSWGPADRLRQTANAMTTKNRAALLGRSQTPIQSEWLRELSVATGVDGDRREAGERMACALNPRTREARSSALPRSGRDGKQARDSRTPPGGDFWVPDFAVAVYTLRLRTRRFRKQ
jgi:hypothetical protein